MIVLRVNPVRRFGLLLSAFAVGALGVGCEAPQPSQPRQATSSYQDAQVFGNPSTSRRPQPEIDAAGVTPVDDIVSVHWYFGQVPWLFNSDRRAVGMQTRAYFVSRETSKGAFVRGDIVVTVSMLARDEAGKLIRVPIDEIVLNHNDAMGMRIRKESLLGYSYGLLIPFPRSLDLSGHQIEVSVAYAGLDGRIVQASPRPFQVPIPPETPLRAPLPGAAVRGG